MTFPENRGSEAILAISSADRGRHVGMARMVIPKLIEMLVIPTRNPQAMAIIHTIGDAHLEVDRRPMGIAAIHVLQIPTILLCQAAIHRNHERPSIRLNATR